nr:hypothetical protein SHINE37_44060 [Rhizobiaceae bacterium]
MIVFLQQQTCPPGAFAASGTGQARLSGPFNGLPQRWPEAAQEPRGTVKEIFRAVRISERP